MSHLVFWIQGEVASRPWWWFVHGAPEKISFSLDFVSNFFRRAFPSKERGLEGRMSTDEGLFRGDLLEGKKLYFILKTGVCFDSLSVEGSFWSSFEVKRGHSIGSSLRVIGGFVLLLFSIRGLLSPKGSWGPFLEPNKDLVYRSQCRAYVIVLLRVNRVLVWKGPDSRACFGGSSVCTYCWS